MTTIFLCVFLVAPVAFAASTSEGLWMDASTELAVGGSFPRLNRGKYRSLWLSLPELEELLLEAPPEESESGVLVSLPMPDGSFQEFLVENSPIMEVALSRQLRGVSTFSAVSSDGSAVTARLDMTPSGFHAIVFRPEGTVYIDPLQSGGEREYVSYYNHDFQHTGSPVQCAVTGADVHVPDRPTVVAGVSVGSVLRTYRIAVAATGEYTQFHGGTVSDGLAAIVTTINRVTAIFEKELSVRLTLVGNNSLVVYTNPATDPYTNGDSTAMLAENQLNLDAVIGNANYDIGHVFGTGNASKASVGVVCNEPHKAKAETSSLAPVGDPFYVGIVAHEIGHQFGAEHTFNGTTGNCSYNRNASAAYEPGSGTTILSYAGTCGIENVQSGKDDYFHTKSFEQMVAHITEEATCASSISTGNTVPAVDAGDAYTVPVSTPLILRADSAIDPDAGQALSYSWEQFDLGAASPPSTDDGSRPIFRSFPPQTGTVRYLPQMSDILGGLNTLGESLPSVDRTLTFRLTVRDNALSGGGVNFSTVAHEVTAAAGPFRVTSQDDPVDWVAGSTQTVTWDVAGTDETPVKCDQVSILWSDNGFPEFTATTLVAATENDGSETITAPLAETSTGRVMVWCVSNIFFAVNDAPITIQNDCGNSLLDAGEQCDDGNIFSGDGCSAQCQVEAGFACSLPVPPVDGKNEFPEGGFEGGTPSPAWAEASTNFGTPICDKDLCGTSGVANTGDWWVWFGGATVLEEASVQQNFLIEETDKELSFARRLRACNYADDIIRLRIDGNEVWRKEDNDPDCGELEYQTERVDLASAPGGPYNDGKSHLIRFESATFGVNGGFSSFDIDDIAILRGAIPPQPSVCLAEEIYTDGFEKR